MVKRFQLEEPEPAKVAEAEIPKKPRGRPFQPGNPGRPRGAKNRTTLLVEQLLAGEADKLTRKFIELANAGNVKCLTLCVDRMMPRRSGRPVNIALPRVTNARDATRVMATITTALNNGDITAEEAGQLVNVLNAYVNVLEKYDLATRLAALESEMKKRR